MFSFRLGNVSRFLKAPSPHADHPVISTNSSRSILHAQLAKSSTNSVIATCVRFVHRESPSFASTYDYPEPTFNSRKTISNYPRYQNPHSFNSDRINTQGSYGRDHNSSSQPDWGNRLTKLDWSSKNLSQVVKNFYIESDEITAKSESEIEDWRKSNNMNIIGPNCPRPIFNFEQTSFVPRVREKLGTMFPDGPSSIQAQGWTLALTGRDMVASAQTGSGKTLAFLLPSMQHIMGQPQSPSTPYDGPRALFLAPTRELAIQINQEAQRFTPCYGLSTACLFGGSNNRMEQTRQLFRKPHICIATPGRLIDFVESKAINLSNVSYIVLDEADRMLDMGFEPQVRAILSQIRPDRQMLMWSATWPKRVQHLANEFLRDSVRIQIGTDEISANKNVEQNWIFCPRGQTLPRLIDIIDQNKGQKILIFSGTKYEADELADELYKQGHLTMSLHGNKPQATRTRILDSFKSGRTKVIIATDIAARGIDVSDISIVINYNMPNNTEDYIHRIGRTGRAGRKGKSISFFTDDDSELVPQLIEILNESHQQVPEEFHTMQQQMEAAKRNARLSNRGPRHRSFPSSSSSSRLGFGSGRNR